MGLTDIHWASSQHTFSISLKATRGFADVRCDSQKIEGSLA